MDISFQRDYSVDASPAAVWEFLNDFDAVGDCIPGVVDYEIEGNHIESEISPPFKFLKGIFSSQSDVAVIEEGEEMHIEMEGQSIGGSFSMTMQIEVEDGRKGTALRMSVDAETRGIFKPVPRSVVEGIVTRIENQMIACVREQV